MDWTKKKIHLLEILRHRFRNFHSNKSTYLTVDSHLRIPILLINPISMTAVSTQTPVRKSRSRKYQHRFNKCLKELLDKYPPYPAHQYLVIENNLHKRFSSSHSNDDDEKHSTNIQEKLFQSREDLLRLNEILEDLDKRLEYLSSDIY